MRRIYLLDTIFTDAMLFYRCADELINMAVSTLALACVCVFPVSGYSDAPAPLTLQILTCLSCARYFYRVGTFVSLDISGGARPLSLFLHHVLALVFYCSILVTNENWWIGVIGNFVEMESMITSTHDALRNRYKAYADVARCCLAIQVLSALFVRLLLPALLLFLFVPELGDLQSRAGTIALFHALVIFPLYNLYILSRRIRKLIQSNESHKPVAAHSTHSTIANNSSDVKASLDLVCASNSYSMYDKPTTWSMVGQEEISRQHPGIKCKQNVFPLPLAAAKKTVRFVDDVTDCKGAVWVSADVPQTERIKATSNINTDCSNNQRKDNFYNKQLISKLAPADIV